MKFIPALLLLLCAPWQAGAQNAQNAPLSLDRAVEMFLERNVEIQAARAEIERAQAEQVAAGVRPNPVLTVTAENLKLSGPDIPGVGSLREVGTTYHETLELGGKRERRQNVAEQTVAVADATFQNVVREKLAEYPQLMGILVSAEPNLTAPGATGRGQVRIRYNEALVPKDFPLGRERTPGQGDQSAAVR